MNHSKKKMAAHNPSLRIQRFMILTMMLLIAAFAALVWRCFNLQYHMSEHYIESAHRQQRGFAPQSPQRGAILDRNGQLLAASNRNRIVFAEPRIIEDAKDTAAILQDILDMSGHLICQMILESRNPGYVRLKEDITSEQASQATRVRGVGVQSVWQRSYPAGNIFSHVVGFTSTDNRGLGGVEYTHNEILTGSAGEDRFYADVRRRPVRHRDSDAQLTDGKGLILTVDTAVQEFARSALQRRMDEFQAEAATAVVAAPDTGEILAMVSLPDFDPGNLSGAQADNLRNRALTDPFEPGSMLKPIAAAIAIDADVISINDTIYCEQGIYRARGIGTIREYGQRGFGDISVTEILVESSNIGTAKIGQKMGNEILYNGLRRFGFTDRTGIDLPGEGKGVLRTTDHWTGYSTTRIPFGQEISVTAMQMVRAFCILANGGRDVRPNLVRAVVSRDGSAELYEPPPPVGYVISPEAAKDVINALAEAVERGTGRRAKLENYAVFGKTGTGQVAASDRRGYSDSEYVASFIAGAPAEEPEIVVLVSIHKPDVSLGKGYTGGTVAGPVVGEIIQKTLDYVNRDR